MVVNLFVMNKKKIGMRKWVREAEGASLRDQLSFQVGFRLSKKAFSPSIASLVFINRSK